MFLSAGFNPSHRGTGIRAFTRHERGPGFFLPAELLVFRPGGDFAWHGQRPRGGGGFLAWGECCMFKQLLRVDFWRLGVNDWNLPQSRWPRRD